MNPTPISAPLRLFSMNGFGITLLKFLIVTAYRSNIEIRSWGIHWRKLYWSRKALWPPDIYEKFGVFIFYFMANIDLSRLNYWDLLLCDRQCGERLVDNATVLMRHQFACQTETLVEDLLKRWTTYITTIIALPGINFIEPTSNSYVVRQYVSVTVFSEIGASMSRQGATELSARGYVT